MRQVKHSHKKIFSFKLNKREVEMIEDLYYKRYNLNTNNNR